MVLAVEAPASLPAQEHVAHSLVQALPADDALAVLRELTFTQIRLEHRRLRLLHLQDERVLPATADKQQHPGTCADTSDTHDLAGHLDETVGLEQVAPVLLEAGDVRGQQVPN